MAEPAMAYVACRGCGELVPLHAAECHACGHPKPRTVDAPAVLRPDHVGPSVPTVGRSGDCGPFGEHTEECA